MRRPSRILSGITSDRQGNLFVADFGGFCIRKVTLQGRVTTLVGSATGGNPDGTGEAAQCARGLAIAPDGTLYITDEHSIRKIK